MDVSDSDLNPGDGRRLGVLAGPPMRLIFVGCEPVSWRWHRVRIVEDLWRFYVADRPGLYLQAANGRLDYHPERVTVIPSSCPFVFHMKPGVGHAFIHVAVPALPAPLVRALVPHPFHLSDPDLVRRLKAVGRAIAAQSAPEALLALQAQAIAADGLAQVLQQLDPADRDRLIGMPVGRLAPALALIEARLAEPLSVADLAQVLGVGAARCSRLFQQELGQPPLHYLLSRRVARAADLLAATGEPLPAIARACGFPNRSYLSRVFAARMGMPPGRYRAIYRG
jgi:AraC-like DNA-binding protein